MELVYLWVEEYKNIKRQGFNFSPRFRCEFNEESNKLTIDNNKSYVNIFTNNVEITTMVGENGSGKSTLFEVLYSNINELKEKILLVLFNENSGELKYISKDIELENLDKYIGDIKSLISIFSNPITDFNNKMETFKPFQSTSFSRFEKNLAELYKELFNDDYFSHYETDLGILNLNLEDILSKNSNTFKSFDERILFTDKKFSLDFSLLDKNIADYDFFKKILEKDSKYESRFLKYILLSRYKSSFIMNKKVKLIFSKNRRLLEKYDFSLNDYSKINEEINIIASDVIHEYSKENIKKVLDIFEYKKDSIWITKEFYNINEDLDLKLLDSWRFFFYLKRHFYKDSNESRDYYSLSSGEKEYLKCLVNFIYIINFKMEKKIFLFDEIELSLHPNWQKRIINDFLYYIDFFNINHQIHLIFSTHSPFLLSDMSKHNILYLEKGKEINILDLNPFGANIHTLLSHGFFMKDGLIGNFAKNKIDNAIKYLSQKILTKEEIDYCENIISIIGEPIIKRQLQKMLDSKRLKKVDKIDDIEKQILKLSQELESLKNGKN